MSSDHAKIRASVRDDIGTTVAKGQAQGFTVAVCEITGITIKYQIEGLHLQTGVAFTTTAPFASIKEARRVLKHASASKLSNEVIAGLILAIAGPTGYRLIDLQTMSALEGNTALRAAPHALLCKVVRVLERLTPQDIACQRGRIAMPECCCSIDHCLKEWYNTLLSLLPTTEYNKLAAETEGLTVITKHAANALTLARAHSSQRLAKYEVSAERSSSAYMQEDFKQAKKQAKELWSGLSEKYAAAISPKLAYTMKALLTGQSLAHCDDNLRAQLVTAITKLGSAQAQTLARIVKETKNPYIKQTPADIALEELDLTPSAPRRSLKEIIDAKKLGSTAQSQCGSTGSVFAQSAQTQKSSKPKATDLDDLSDF